MKGRRDERDPTAARAPSVDIGLQPPRRPARSPRWAVAQFLAGGLAAVLVISLAVILVLRTYAREQAVGNARDIAIAAGRAAIVPFLVDGVLTEDTRALAALDGKVRSRVLNDRVVRVKVWDAGGRIVYSDEPRLIGQSFVLGPDERAALDTGRAHAGLTNLASPENLFERPYHKLLEVYVGLRTAGGHPVLFEAYLRYHPVAEDQSRLLTAISPALVGGLLLLLLIQTPLAWSMSKRVQEGQRERERLLQRALDAGEHERRRIAADLHDSVVQSLAGTAFALGGVADRATKAGNTGEATLVTRAAKELRQAVRDLRTLIVAMAPPRLHEEGLGAALEDLVSPLTARGLEARLEVSEVPLLSQEAERLIFRVAQEAVRNVVSHADAARVELSVGRADGGQVQLVVTDDGQGFGAEEARRSMRDGHVGLRLLAEVVADAGGSLTMDSEPGRGTSIRVRVPST